MKRSGLIIVFAVFALFAWVTGINFHVVEPGELYRSAQLSPLELKAFIRLYGIKTVVNLRGVEKRPWYYGEQQATSDLGVHYVSIDMSARTIPDRDAELTLIDTFRNAPKPILIHCRSGADRTGEAAAIYEMVFMHKPKKEALKMLYPRYLHFHYFRPAKNYFVDLFQGEDWLRANYFPCAGHYQYYNPHNPDCNRAVSSSVGL